MQSVDQEGKTLDEALEKAISSLKCKKEDIEYEILDEGSKGIFGVGARPYLVRVRLKQEVLQEEKQENNQAKNILKEENNHKKEFTEKNNEEIKEVNYNRENNTKLSDEDIKKVKDILNSFCTNLSLDLKEINFSNENHNVKVDIETDDANLLIGKHGKTLESLQYLLNQIMHQEKPRFFLDISNYKVKQNEKLITLIKNIAERVNNTKRKVTLNPMSSSDRKIVHEVIKEYPELTTKSMGIEPNRKVVIQHNESDNIRRPNNFKRKPFDKNNRNFKSPNKPFKKRNFENNSETQEQA